MGTRSLTLVHTEDGSVLLNMYRQYDGYPTGHGAQLADFLNSFDAVVNGLPVGDNRKLANGMGCLAAQLVAEFKTGAGGIYIYPTDARDCWQEYEYHVHEKTVMVYDGKGKCLFHGNWKEFGQFCSPEPLPVVDYTTEDGQIALKESLYNGVVSVLFVKKDGTEREMRCTLKPELVGQTVVTDTEKKRKDNPDVCAVYDLDNNGWRSFRFDSILKVN